MTSTSAAYSAASAVLLTSAASVVLTAHGLNPAQVLTLAVVLASLLAAVAYLRNERAERAARLARRSVALALPVTAPARAPLVASGTCAAAASSPVAPPAAAAMAERVVAVTASAAPTGLSGRPLTGLLVDLTPLAVVTVSSTAASVAHVAAHPVLRPAAHPLAPAPQHAAGPEPRARRRRDARVTASAH